MATDTRQQMIATAARLFQRDGYDATSWRGLVDAAGTPWGSVHHHFPGGKEELGVAAVAYGGGAVSAALRHCFASEPDPADAIRTCFSLSAAGLEASDFTAGCPLATLTLETVPASAAIGEAAKTAFDEWTAIVAGALEEAGIARARAAELAEVVIELYEGALLLARVSRSTRPLQTAADHIASVLDAEPAGATAPSP